MRRLLLLVSLVLAGPAVAQDWHRLPDDEATYGAMNAILDGDKSEAENLKAAQAAFGPQGVFYGESSTGRADDSKEVRIGAWRTGAELKRLKGLLSDAIAGLDGLECAQHSECTVGMSHAMAHLVLRQNGKTPHIVGLFYVDSMLDATGQAHVDALLTHWRAAIDQRYGPQKPLPPVSAAPANAQAVEQARRLNTEALAALKKKAFKPAIAAFEQAVHADPGHYLARYNLACAYSLAGQFKASQSVLTAFKTAKNCPACQVRLVRAQKDTDFNAQRKDPAFEAIVSGVQVPKVPLKAVGAAVNAVFAGASSDLTAVVDPLRLVTVKINNSLNEESRTQKIQGRDLVKQLMDLDSPLNPVTQMVCTAGCCTGKAPPMLHNNLFLDKICVKAGAAGWVTLDRIEITDGN